MKMLKICGISEDVKYVRFEKWKDVEYVKMNRDEKDICEDVKFVNMKKDEKVQILWRCWICEAQKNEEDVEYVKMNWWNKM